MSAVDAKRNKVEIGPPGMYSLVRKTQGEDSSARDH